MTEYYEAICPECDNIIEIEKEEAWDGNEIHCTNSGCFFVGTIDEIREADEGNDAGQVFFQKE